MQSSELVKTELMVYRVSDTRRIPFARFSAAVPAGRLQKAGNDPNLHEHLLNADLDLGVVNTFLVLKSNKNLFLVMQDAQNNQAIFPVAQLFCANIAATKVILRPISSDTVITAYFY
jgi:adenosine/AMP kinase